MSTQNVAINSPDGKYLEDYALKHLWANPRLESNLVYQPSKLTSNLPIRSSFKYQGYSIGMPDSNSRWHIYQMHVANIPTIYFEYDPRTIRTWVKVSDLVTDHNALITFYEESGLVYPSSLVYMRSLYNGLLLFAVYAEDYQNLRLRTDKLKVHFYSNKSELNVVVDGVLNDGSSAFTVWWNKMRSYQTLDVGYTSIFINGFFTKDVKITDIAIGDYVEFQYDSSVQYVNSFLLEDLDTLTDDKDPNDVTDYYLLMNWSNDGIGEVKPYDLHYKNDVSFFITNSHNRRGLRIKRGGGVDIKQLTHQDLAISTNEINYYTGQMNDEYLEIMGGEFLDSSEIYLTLITREDGQQQKWEGDMNRVTELYLLNDKELIKQAMLGITATVDEWLAKNLIYNRYITMLECEYSYLDGLTIWDGLGYYACDNIINRMPITASALNSESSVTYRYSHTQAVANVLISYEIDNGKMVSVEDYTEVNSLSFDHSVGLYEVYAGKFVTGSENFDYLNEQTVELEEGVWWHFYIGTRTGVNGALEWQEIKQEDVNFGNFAVVNNGVLNWLVDYQTYSTAVRRSDTIYLAANGSERIIDNCVFKIPSTLAFGEMTMLLNDTSLVYGVDYTVSWPYVAITSKKHVLATGVNNYVRPYLQLRGFPTEEGKHQFNGEVGFVRQGLLSLNNRYLLNGWRNYRLVVDGSVKTLDSTVWEEDVNRYRVGAESVNGVPYSIMYPFSYTLATLEEYLYQGSKQEDDEIDTRISACLDSYVPKAPDLISTFPEPYELFSPFTHAIIKDMLAGSLGFVYKDIATHGLDVLLDKYLYLKDLCPTINNEHIRWDVCRVHPHGYNSVVYITADQLRILEEINAYYLNNKLSVTESIRLKRT